MLVVIIKMVNKIEIIFTYVAYWIRSAFTDTFNILLLGTWLTGVLAGMVKKSAFKIKLFVEGCDEKYEPPSIIKELKIKNPNK